MSQWLILFIIIVAMIFASGALCAWIALRGMDKEKAAKECPTHPYLQAVHASTTRRLRRSIAKEAARLILVEEEKDRMLKHLNQ